MDLNSYLLHLKIIQGREKLVKMSEKYGIGDPKVLAYSKQLDKLIVQMMREITE